MEEVFNKSRNCEVLKHSAETVTAMGKVKWDTFFSVPVKKLLQDQFGNGYGLFQVCA